MAPPVLRETFAHALGHLRQILIAARETQDAKEVLMKVFLAIEATAEISGRLVLSVGAVEDKVETWIATRSHSQKSLSESKCIGNLKSLGSDKAEFKTWNDKLINALA